MSFSDRTPNFATSQHPCVAYFVGMIGAALAVSFLSLTSAFIQNNEIEEIQSYVKSYQQNDFLEGSSSLCSTYSCCNVTSSDSCPLMKFTKDQSVLVLPGLFM
jgi:hypothetical protein